MSGPVVRSGAVAGGFLPQTSHLSGSPFGSTLAHPHGAPTPTFGAANPSSETPLFQLPSHNMGAYYSGCNMLHAAQLAPDTVPVHPGSVGGSQLMGGVGMVQTGPPVGNPLLLGTGMGQSSLFGGGGVGGATPQIVGGVQLQPQLLSGSGFNEMVSNNNNNPFLF